MAMARRRVLIVEDNIDAAEMLGLLVDSLGHDVRVAHHVDAAIAVFDEYAPDVVLSDLGLPDVDGFAFAEHVRAGDVRRASETLLVAISGYGSAKDKSRAEAAGFDAHLTKPLDIHALERLLRERLPESAA